ncbi:hypothetical protein QTP88_008578 [Uroleucon formosanum]
MSTKIIFNIKCIVNCNLVTSHLLYGNIILKSQQYKLLDRDELEAYCTLYKSYFKVYHGGKSDIVDHIKCNKHKKNSQSVNISEQVTKFFVTPDTKEEKLVAAAELVNVLATDASNHKSEKIFPIIIQYFTKLDGIKRDLKNRQINKFIGLKVLEMLRKEKISDQVKHTFYEEVDEFYNTAITYLAKWSVSTNHFYFYDWMFFLESIAWHDVKETIIYLSDKNIQLDDSLFDQLTYFKKRIEVLKNSKSDWNSKIASEKWHHLFSVSIHVE